MSRVKSKMKKDNFFREKFNESNKEDFSNPDMLHLEKEVKEMMESVMNIHVKLSQDVILDDSFKLTTSEENTKPVRGTDENDLRAYLEEIEKMDAIIKMKMVEEKKVKLSRIQKEEESRSILSELTNCRMSEAIKLNGQEYLNLLNEVEKGGCEQREEAKENISANYEEPGKLKKCESQQPTFIERNIQLARCGRGTLSLTKDEELRIQTLLKELEDSNLDSKTSTCSNSSDSENNAILAKDSIYAFDDESKSMLSQIDEKLQVYVNLKSLETCPSKLSVLSREIIGICEENKCDKTETVQNKKNTQNKGKKKKKYMKNRLKEINKLLSYINSTSSEEINPLSQEEIEFLIDEARLSLEKPSDIGPNKNDSQTTVELSNDPLCFEPSHEIIAELVKNAKSLMPKFKYRFDDS